MSYYDIGALLIAIRATLPTSKLKIFEDTLYRAAMSPCASEDLRWAVGIEPRGESESRRPFEVIAGGAA